MHRLLSILLALLLAAAGAAAQTDLPQMFSPNAAELGKYGYHSDRGHLGTYTVSLMDLNPYRNYILDYWRRTGAGHWEYVRTSFTGNAAIGGPGMTVDQVRVFPEDAEAESYTWDDVGNLLSRSDGRGVTESYEYDGLGRLTVIRDNDGNIIEQYEYKYQNR